MDLSARHQGTQAAMRGFAYDHLPPHLQAVSRPFCERAYALLDQLPDDPLLVRALNHLWESKNCAVLLAGLVADGSLPPVPR